MINIPLKIQGKKTKLVPDIKMIAESILTDHPEIDTWVEPFLGSGTVAFNCADLSQIKKVIVNDVNPHIISFYKAVADGTVTGDNVRSTMNVHSMCLKDMGNEYYDTVKNRFNKTHMPNDFLFLTRTGFNGVMRFNGKGEWNVPFCKINERLSDKVIGEISKGVDDLRTLFSQKKFIFHCGSFEGVMASAPKTSIFYCDPPYFGLDTKYYKDWCEDDEMRLHDLLEGKQFIYSTWLDNGKKDNPMIEKLWKDYPVFKKEHKYMLAEKASDRKKVTEGIFYTGKDMSGSLW